MNRSNLVSTALERDPGAVELAPLLAASYAHLGRREDARAALLKWQPEASQFQLERATTAYHFLYRWADRSINERLSDGLQIAALPLETTVSSLAEALKQGKTLASGSSRTLSSCAARASS